MNDFRGETLFKNWLYKVAANSCYKFKRKGKDQPELELSIEQFLPHSDKPKLGRYQMLQKYLKARSLTVR